MAIDITKCKRIMIIGNSSSGKSTLAHQLSEKLNIPVYFLDVYAHEPDSKWIRTPIAEFIQKHTKITKNKQWIIEGNYSVTMEDRINLADLVIFMHINRFSSCFNFIKRRFSKKNRYGTPKGCKDKLQIRQIKHIFMAHPERTKKYKEMLSDKNNVIYITSFRSLLRFKKQLGLEIKNI